MSRRLAWGKRGEALAAAYLERQGLQLVETNWRCRLGEIDLVLRDGEVVVFVEVRLRTRSDFGGAAESIDARKRSKLLAAARLYLARCPDVPSRFDALLVDSLDPPGIRWVRNAISE